MVKIVLRDLHPTDVGTFLYNLNSEEMQNVLGGISINSITNNTGTVLMNTTGSNTNEGDNSFNFRDNKIYTIDYSRSIYNFFFFFYY
jgi:hypothetical protein